MLPIAAHTLIEIEYELNRRDILHCRVLSLEPTAGDTLTVSAPPAVAHGYAFRAGDRLDLFCSLLAAGNTHQVLHLKATVLEPAEASGRLLLRRSDFQRTVRRPAFHLLPLQQTVLLAPVSDSREAPWLEAAAQSLTLTKLHLHMSPSPPPEARYRCSLSLADAVFDLTGSLTADHAGAKSLLGHPVTLHLEPLTPEEALRLADAMESLQRGWIIEHVRLGARELHSRPAPQEGLILEHLVPLSRFRKAVDGLTLASWGILVLILFDLLLAAPPGPNLFDRFFGLTASPDWNTLQLRNVPLLALLNGLLAATGILLHLWIFWNGNTRTRLSLWAAALFTLLAWLAARPLF